MSYRVENRFIGTVRHFNFKYLLIKRHANTQKEIR